MYHFIRTSIFSANLDKHKVALAVAIFAQIISALRAKFGKKG